MAHEFAGPIQAELAGQPLEARMARVAAFLTERGYLARWERDENDPQGGFLLHKCNCPYAGLSDEHGELCVMDQALVNALIGQPCQRIFSMADDGRCCTYRVGAPEPVAIRLIEIDGVAV
jgi:predicted ArsR family transcriptional regulator